MFISFLLMLYWGIEKVATKYVPPFSLDKLSNEYSER